MKRLYKYPTPLGLLDAVAESVVFTRWTAPTGYLRCVKKDVHLNLAELCDVHAHGQTWRWRWRFCGAAQPSGTSGTAS
jgi:hypothetical protein